MDREAASPASFKGGTSRADTDVGAFGQDAPVDPVLLDWRIPDGLTAPAADSPRPERWGGEVVGVPSDDPVPDTFAVGEATQSGARP